jgi:hypothetical protein
MVASHHQTFAIASKLRNGRAVSRREPLPDIDGKKPHLIEITYRESGQDAVWRTNRVSIATRYLE